MHQGNLEASDAPLSMPLRKGKESQMKRVLLLLVSLASSIATSALAQPSPENLKTQTANQLGLTVSGYIYDEPSLNVKMTDDRQDILRSLRFRPTRMFCTDVQ